MPGRNRDRAQIPVGVAIEGQESQQRQVAPTVVVAVEERQLLGAMRAVVGRVQVDDDPSRPAVEPPAWCPMMRVASSPPIRYSAVRVARLSNREIVGCEAAGTRATGSRPISSFWDGVVGQMLSVVAVGMTAGDAEDPLAREGPPRCASPCRVRAGRPDTARMRPPARTPSRPPSEARRPRRSTCAADRNEPAGNVQASAAPSV